jgi:nucleotide-binding universal stress UspA family protein
VIEISRILTPIDFSTCSEHALAYALALSRWYESRVTALHVFVNWPLVNVIPSLQPVVVPAARFETFHDELARHARGFVEAVAGPEADVDVMVEEAPDVAGEILAQAGRLEAKLIVMGTHGRGGVDRWLVGSTTEKLLRKASCPVMVVPPRAHEVRASQPVQFHRILCPIDFSAGSLAALTYAMSMAEEADAQLTLLHAVELPHGMLETALSSAFDVRALVPDDVRTYCSVETVVCEGRPSPAILGAASERRSDLIVMGVRGRGALNTMLFGSNTHAVIQAAACPVLTVRG